jgi:hypothetical protein
MTPAEKVRENRLRRMAKRRGLRLHKSPRRDPGAIGYGRYLLAKAGEPYDSGDMAYKLTLDEIEEMWRGHAR